ncbi:acyl carrier protein [Zavarzinella formosa]|uniref:acyl carrier protein n=1 Tax=Zavarzinella formosa TaxID=360055 RepID=UPI000312F7F3|nr:acyl carrier protein [Zavarzinella formosa]
MIDRGEVVKRLGDILTENTEVDVSKLTEASKIREELGLDSVDLVDVVMRIEGAYKIRLTHQDLQSVETIADLVTLIITKSETQNPGGTGQAVTP